MYAECAGTTPNRGELLAEALQVSEKVIGSYDDAKRELLYETISAAVLEAANKWDGRGTFRSFARWRIRYRIQDYWRRRDHLSRMERKAMKCQQCGFDPESDLTPREMSVWELHSAGLTHVEGAKRLGISDKTFAYYIQLLKAKLGVRSGPASGVMLAKLYYERSKTELPECESVRPAHP